MSIDVHDLVLGRPELADLDPAERRLALRDLLDQATPEDAIPIAARISDSIDGYGPLTAVMRDARITDVLVNAHDEVWVDDGGTLRRLPDAFDGPEALRAFIERMTSISGARVDASSPIVDARLPDGSRLHVVLPPLSGRGPLVSIRKFPRDAFDLADLVAMDMLTDDRARVLAEAVRDRRTIAVSGATGTGKTTLLNALLGLVPASERVVLIEETPELRPRCSHVVSLVARPPNIEGRGAIPLVDLFRASLRMRPDRIVVGEVRGAEARVALDAMSTGHEGSMVTVHARTAAEAVERFVSLAAQDGSRDQSSLRDRFTRAFDLVVQLERVDGVRRLTEIAEP